jgi:hypothetical protein
MSSPTPDTPTEPNGVAVAPSPVPRGPRHREDKLPAEMSRTKKIWLIIGTLVVFILMGLAVVNSLINPPNDPIQIAPAPSVAPVTGPPHPTFTADVTNEKTTDTPSAPKNVMAHSFNDGTWIVGKDIVSGIYRSPGRSPGEARCVAVIKDGDTVIGGVVTSDGPARVDAKDGQTIEAKGCRLWNKVENEVGK